MLNISTEIVKAKRHRLLWVLIIIMIFIEIIIIGGLRYWTVNNSKLYSNPRDEQIKIHSFTSFPGVILPTLTFSATFGTIFAVVFTARLGSEEYQFGTAKQMISMGVDRYEYAFTKMLASIFISVIFIIAPITCVSLFAIIISILFKQPLINEPITISLILKILKGAGIAWVCLGFYTSLTVFLVTVTRNGQSAATIGILMILLEGNIINSFAERFLLIRRIAPYSMGRCANIVASLIESNNNILGVVPYQGISKVFVILGFWFVLFTISTIIIFRIQELGLD